MLKFEICIYVQSWNALETEGYWRETFKKIYYFIAVIVIDFFINIASAISL